jgi:hypothetical protein
MVLAMADAENLEYEVATTEGTTTQLSAAPKESFTPGAVWLDESRLLVTTTGNDQVSRLGVVDTGTGTLKPSQSVSGVRVIGLSGDRLTACLATEAAVFVGPVDSLLAPDSPTRSVTLASGQVVWGLTLDTNGSRLYMFSGTVASDGKVGSVQELGYAKQGPTWVQVLGLAVPFGRAIGQVFLA